VRAARALSQVRRPDSSSPGCLTLDSSSCSVRQQEEKFKEGIFKV